MLRRIKLGKMFTVPGENKEMILSVMINETIRQTSLSFWSTIGCGEIIAVLCQEKISSEMVTSCFPSGPCATQRQHCAGGQAVHRGETRNIWSTTT